MSKVGIVGSEIPPFLIATDTSKSLDSSLKRHTGLIKRMKQSLAAENRESNLKDIESLNLEKYIEEIAGAAAEGILRCKTDKDVWAAAEVSFHALLLLS